MLLKKKAYIKILNAPGVTPTHPYAVIYKVEFLGFTIKRKCLVEFRYVQEAQGYLEDLCLSTQ